MKKPLCTYRIQFHKDFRLTDLENILDYIYHLGVDTIYASPIFKSMPGSTHGYDVTNPFEINDEIGSLEDLRRISKKLKEKGMLWLQDIVPNHMAFSAQNGWIHDVLREGKSSAYAAYFDIDFNSPLTWLNGKLLVPFLGEDAQTAIRNGSIKMVLKEDGFYFTYYDNLFPVNANSLPLIAFHATDEMAEILKKASAELSASKAIEQRRRQWEELSETLMSERFRAKTNELLDALNSNTEARFEILREQHYVLAHYNVTNSIINYRRFFTINGLISLRMEDEEVFNHYHRFILQLCAEGIFDGLRIDHIDGLLQPELYLSRLKAAAGRDVYVVVEKILAQHESLPETWPTEGTTGYDFLGMASKLLTDAEGAAQLKDFYHRIMPCPEFSMEAANSKKTFLETFMAGELDNITEQFCTIDELKPYDKSTVKQSLSAIMVALPTYRIYAASGGLPTAQQQVLAQAIEEAGKKHERLTNCLSTLFNLFVRVNPSEHLLTTVNRFMQLSGPLAAKGIEDTAFYNYNVLISHNEVGNSPTQFSVGARAFFEYMANRKSQFPFAMNATATHDTKRGEDSRMRIQALSEIPDDWMRWTQDHLRQAEATQTACPSLNDQYYIFQSMIGGLPPEAVLSKQDADRLKAAVTKALRESKRNSSWHEPNEAYEAVCMQFIDDCFSKQAFVESLKALLALTDSCGKRLSLAQTALKLLSPGVPDIYRGSEAGDFSYVDPDNRRAVDFDTAKSNLHTATISSKDFEEQKAALIKQLLHFRKAKSSLFDYGKYECVEVANPSVFCFSFSYQSEIFVIAICTRGKQGPEIPFPVSVQQPFDLLRQSYLENDVIDLKAFPVAVIHGHR